MLNGLLLASYSVWCSCVLGGTCCGGVCQCGDGECCEDFWQTGAGKCCDNVWHPTGTNLCGEGKHLAWSSTLCCACVDDGKTIADLCCSEGIEIHEKQDGECKRRCCDAANPASCINEYPADCTNTSTEGSCSTDGCPGACCSENAEGTEVACVDVEAVDCISPAIKDNTHACGVDACHGMCCNFDENDGGAYTSYGVMSLADCIAGGGDFQGVGTTECLNCNGDTDPGSNRCRPPFDECCCEEKTSKGAGLVFTAPRNKQRLPPFDAGSSKQFTVELKTESDIRIHGKLFSAYSQCLTTVICHDEFNVEPVPCGSNFTNLWIKVCWNDHGYTREDLPFPECQGVTIWLGNCGGTEVQFCTTYTTYSGNGLTSDVDIVLYGDAHITANGTGPLVITAPITNQGTCVRTLTIDGGSTQLNSINGGIQDVPATEKLTVVKDGAGTWRLGASSSFEGQLQIKQGTLIAGVGTQDSGSGVFGGATSPGLLPMVGDSSGGATSFAAMLLEDDVVINRSLNVAVAYGGSTIGPPVILGGANTTGISTFAYNTECRTGRSVTLQCATGGTVDFGCVWLNSAGTGNHAFSYTIGTAGNLGTVRLSNPLATTGGSVSINCGTLMPGFENAIDYTTPVSIGTAATSGTLQLYDTAYGNNVSNSLALSSLTFYGAGSFVANTGAGALTMKDGPQPAKITIINGSDHEISSNMVLENDLEVSINTSSQLTITGMISGPGKITQTGSGGQLRIIVSTPISGPASFTSATFINDSLAVTFATCPEPCDEFVLLPPGMVQVTGSPVLTCPGEVTGVYDWQTSTLKIIDGTAPSPTFQFPYPTADGFTSQISNYDALYTYAGTATASGSVSVSGSGLVTVTGVAAGTSSIATITTSRECYLDGSGTVTAISLP